MTDIILYGDSEVELSPYEFDIPPRNNDEDSSERDEKWDIFWMELKDCWKFMVLFCCGIIIISILFIGLFVSLLAFLNYMSDRGIIHQSSMNE